MMLSLILGLLSLPLASRGAENAPPPDRAAQMAKHLQHLAKDLGLTDQQKTQIGDILRKEADQLTALRDDESMARREKFKAMRKIREEGRQQIRALLTPEQQAKFDAMPKPKPGRGGPGREGPPPAE